MNFFRIGLVFAGVLTAGSALAADLKAPFELETSQVLPPGVRNPRIKNLFMSVENRFNGTGAAEPLGQKLNKVITWGDILAAQDTDDDRALVEGFLQKNGISPDRGGPGSSTGVVNTFASVRVPVLAMGITERLTLALAVPVFDVRVDVDTGLVRSGQGERFIKESCEVNPVKCNDAAAKINDPINSKLKRYKYKPLGPMRVSGVGDVKFVGKYLAFRNELNSLSVKSDLTLPTGREADPDRALDVPLGDGQYDVGAALIWDRKFSEASRFRLNTYGAYTLQLPDTVTKRLPSSATDSLSPDKEELKRNMGDIVSVGTSLSYDVPGAGLVFGAGYSFQYLSSTSYRDGAFSSNRYRLLEDEFPSQDIHSATLVAGFSTVQWFREKKFVYPFQANLAFSRPLAGRNVTRNDVFAAELVLFF